jgi:hypothetical protein
VGVEAVHHQDDLLGVGIVDVAQLFDLGRPVDAGAPGQGVGPASSGQGLAEHEDRARALALVLVVLFAGPARFGRDRVADVVEQLVCFVKLEWAVSYRVFGQRKSVGI